MSINNQPPRQQRQQHNGDLRGRVRGGGREGGGGGRGGGGGGAMVGLVGMVTLLSLAITTEGFTGGGVGVGVGITNTAALRRVAISRRGGDRGYSCNVPEFTRPPVRGAGTGLGRRSASVRLVGRGGAQALSMAVGSRGAGAEAEAGAGGLMVVRVSLNSARAATLAVCSLLGSVQPSILILATKAVIKLVASCAIGYGFSKKGILDQVYIY
eukprot:jgi/Undpi1/7760/HiC_scaffold_23.g10233.m1